MQRGGRLVLPGLGRMLWTQPGGLLGWDCSKAAGAGTPSPSCMPMRLTWSAAGSIDGKRDPAGAAASQVAELDCLALLRCQDLGFTLRLFAGLRVRVTQVQPGRWKELHVTIRARPGRLSALSE